MITTTQNQTPIVQMYHKVREKEYTVRHQGFIFSWEEVVRTEQIENILTLSISADKMPDKIYFNGQLVTLTPQ